MAFSEASWQGSWPGTRWQVLGPQRQVVWCHCCLNRTDAEAVMAVSVKDVFPMSCSQCWWIGQSLHYLWEARTLTESQEKEGLMLVVCLYSCSIVEILEGSGMLDNSSQKFTPRVQVFHQTHFFASSSSRNIVSIHLVNSFRSGPAWGKEGWALALRLCPALWPGERARGRRTTENGLPP